MSAFALRILLMASLALWSPAWCCCAVRAMADDVKGDSAGLACCSRTPTHESRVVNCCEHDGSKTPCRCADRVVEQQRLDTSSKVGLPRVTIERPTACVDHALALIPMTAGLPATTQRMADWHPPPDTLLAQCCLLIV